MAPGRNWVPFFQPPGGDGPGRLDPRRREMSDELDALRAEVAALRAELAEQRTASVTRRRLLTGLAGLGAAGAAGAAGVAFAQPAAAADGQPLLIGETNTSTAATRLTGEVNGDAVLRV